MSNRRTVFIPETYFTNQSMVSFGRFLRIVQEEAECVTLYLHLVTWSPNVQKGQICTLKYISLNKLCFTLKLCTGCTVAMNPSYMICSGKQILHKKEASKCSEMVCTEY